MGDVTYAPRQPGNYIQEYNDQFRKAPSKYPSMDIESLAELAAYGQLMSESSCWVLNESARDFIMNTTLPSDALENWNLPYPRMTIEWLGTWDVDAVMKHRKPGDQLLIPALERIITLTDFSELDVDIHSISDKQSTTPQAISGCYIQSYFKQPVPSEMTTNNDGPMPWMLNPVALVLPYHALHHLDTWFGKGTKEEAGDLRMDVDLFATEISPSKPTATCALPSALHQWEHMVASGMARQGVRDLIEEVHIALGLLAMLRCDNVPSKVIQASPLKQRRRKQQKKTRIPDYRVLHISDHTLRGYAGGKGTHGEKAPHWRRGHIRMQPTAMGAVRRWIAPQIIRADKLNGDMPLPKTAVT